MLSSNLSPKIVAGRRCSCPDRYFHSAYRFGTRILAHVYGLLGPCFKTGRMTPCKPTYWGDPTTTRHLRGEHPACWKPTFSSAPPQRKISPCPAMGTGSPLGAGTRRHRGPRVATSHPSMSALHGGCRSHHRMLERRHTT